MAESLKEVIARLKAQQQPSQKSEPKEVPVPTPTEDFDEEEGEEEEISQEPQNKPLIHKKIEKVDEEINKQREQILMEIAMLQDNGRYRVEMLHQMQEMNRALVVIAGVLADISGSKR